MGIDPERPCIASTSRDVASNSRGVRLPLFFATWIAVRSRGRLPLVLAAVLVGVPGVLSLIGGIGLLMLPSSILLLVAAARS